MLGQVRDVVRPRCGRRLTLVESPVPVGGRRLPTISVVESTQMFMRMVA